MGTFEYLLQRRNAFIYWTRSWVQPLEKLLPAGNPIHHHACSLVTILTELP